MAVRIGDVVLPGVETIEITERVHDVRLPVLGGVDVVQILGRTGLRFVIKGTLAAEQSDDGLLALRRMLATGTQQQMLISSLTDIFSTQVVLTDLAVAQRSASVHDSCYQCTFVERASTATTTTAGLTDDASLWEGADAALDEGRSLADAIAGTVFAADSLDDISPVSFDGLVDPALGVDVPPEDGEPS